MMAEDETMKSLEQAVEKTLDLNEVLHKKGLAAAGSELERMMASVDRILKMQRDKKFTIEAQYSADRAAVIERHRAAIERIRQAAEDELQSFDARHGKRIAELDAILEKLQVLRGL